MFVTPGLPILEPVAPATATNIKIGCLPFNKLPVLFIFLPLVKFKIK